MVLKKGRRGISCGGQIKTPNRYGGGQKVNGELVIFGSIPSRKLLTY